MSNWSANISPWWMAFAWFLVILTLRYEWLMAPPVWDSAMGLFPPAIYLVQNSFDVDTLLHLEGWRRGGPNVHTFSLLTWLIAGLFEITGSAKVTFLVLHLATFAAMAWALNLFTRLLRDWSFDEKTAIAAGLFVLLMPMVLVQVGRMYTEIPVLVLAIAALDAYAGGKKERAALYCGIAVFFKLTAVSLAGALLLALLLDREPFDWKKARTITWLIGAPVLGLIFLILVVVTSNENISWGSFGDLIGNARFRLSMVPDLYLLLVLGLACSALLLPQIIAQNLRSEPTDGTLPGIGPDQWNVILIGVVMPLAYVATILAIIYTGQLGLHRYFVPLVPFALVTVLLMLRRLRVQWLSFPLLILSCVFFLLNQQGRYYPHESTSFSIVERSDEADQFHEVQVLGIRMLQRYAGEVPVGVSREIGYMISDPMMGYVERKIPNTFLIYREPYASMPLAEFPAQLGLLHTNQSHGGQQIERLIREARNNPAYSITAEVRQRGPFIATLYTIKRGRDKPAGVD